jgi:hypothetical protein
MTSEPFTALDPDASIEERIAEISERILDARRVQWNASQMNDARGVFATERILDGLYAERDALVAQLMANPNYPGSPTHY